MDLEIPVAGDADSNPSSHTCKLSSTVTAHKTPYAIGLLRVEHPPTDGSSSGDEDGVSCGDLKATLHLAPLDACVQMRPDLWQIDEETGDGAEVLPTPSPGGSSTSGAAGDKSKGAGPSGSAGAGTSGAGGAVTSTSVLPVFKRAETEKEEEARRSSHAYWLEQRESEPWLKLQLHDQTDPATDEVRRDTFGLLGSSQARPGADRS
jgi:DNA-directed RNA polymerase-3 subunit RPC5